MADCRALAARLARLETRRATGAGCWLLEMKAGATDAEVAAAVAARRAAGATGPVVIGRRRLTPEEWTRLYDPTARRG